MGKSPAEFKPPSLKLTQDLIRPFKQYFAPRFYGIDKLDKDRPALLISNHSVLGVTDGFFIGSEIYKRKGIFIRALADNMHFQVPLWKDVSTYFGFLPGNQENCTALMKDGQHILVFPGGTREVCKLRGEKYHLTWKKRLGFARMAVESGYDIIPVTSIGGEELYDVLADSLDIMESPVGKWLEKSGLAEKLFKGGENIPPIVKGVGLSIIPKPARIYISFGDRIETKQYEGKVDDKEILWKVRKEVENAMQSQFKELFRLRKEDKEPQEWWRTLLMNL